MMHYATAMHMEEVLTVLYSSVSAILPCAFAKTTNKMAEKWKKFKEEMKLKRTGKKVQKDSRDEIVVQRLSSSVSGKAQKYTRVGPREFVDFVDRDLTIDNIKDACMKHFGQKIGEDMVCDVLAGEQGPSCSSIKQLPNVKLIHVRFIEDESDNIIEVTGEKKQGQKSSLKRKHHSGGALSLLPASLPSPEKKRNEKRMKVVPKSLSVSTILKLGRVIESSNNVTLVNLYTFNLELMIWSSMPLPVEFVISTDLLGEGGFRKAYKATSTIRDFTHCHWVVKRYKESAVKEIQETNQTLEIHTRKVCNVGP